MTDRNFPAETIAVPLCKEQVWPSEWVSHPCGRPVRWGISWDGGREQLCGIHARKKMRYFERVKVGYAAVELR